MQVAAPDREKLQAESYLAWWRNAGVDYLCADEPVNWLVEDAPEQAIVPSQSRPAPTAMAGAVAVPPARKDWPADFSALMRAIATDTSIPGNSFGRRIAAPYAVANADLMVFCDFPEEAELVASAFGHGPTGQLLKAMIRACGFDLTNVHIGALAHSRPASGALPPQDAQFLRDFAQHQIAVVKPERLLLLGSSVSEMLVGQDLMVARADLREFNHDGRKMAAVATFHPRTLLARPILKAQAWQDLQVIVKKDRS